MGSSTASSLGALAFALLLAPAASAAEPSAADKSLAQALFEQGRSLMDGKRYAEACPRFADSERLDPGGGTVLNLALCYDKLGKLALAYSTYNEALSAAIAERRGDRESFARERIAALGARLPRLTVRVDDASAQDAQVRLDGVDVPPSAWGSPTPVDPGRHTIDASAPARRPYEAILTLREGEVRELAVTFAQEASVSRASTPVGEGARYEQRRSPVFWTLGGVSVAALGTSAVTGALAWSAHQSFDQACNASRHYCDNASGPGDASRARSMAWISTLTLGGGLLAGLGAIALPLTERMTVAAGPGAMALQTIW